MKKNQDQPADAAELRRRAEERLQTRERTPQSALDTERFVHELQVHQIELEMQNEELRQMSARAGALTARYTDLYEFAPTGYLTLDPEGVIRQVNLAGARLLGVGRSQLVKRRLGLFVAEGDRRAFSDFLQRVFASQAKQSCEVTLPQAGQHPLYVRIEGTRSADGQECLAVVVDLTKRKTAEERIRAQARLLDLAQDAIAVRDMNGGVPRWC
jgi:PAS domain S-box-containing protein